MFVNETTASRQRCSTGAGPGCPGWKPTGAGSTRRPTTQGRLRTEAYAEAVPLPPFSASVAFTDWRFDPLIAVTLVVVGAGYAVGFARIRRTTTPLPWWRLAAFVVLGLGGIAVCTMSSLAVYQHTDLWALAVQMTLLISIVPVCLALGAPVEVVRGLGGEGWQARWDRWLHSRVVRFLTFPVVAAVLGVGVQMYLYFGPLLGAALRSRVTMDATYLLVLVAGCLLALPLLGAELLPDWCTEPMRLLFAAIDGLLDAIPGIAVMTTGALLAGGFYRARAASTADALGGEHVAGALVLALAEVVSLPLLIILFFRWAAGETRRTTPSAALVSTEPVSVPDEPVLERPWWETDAGPRRTDEYRGRRE